MDSSAEEPKRVADRIKVFTSLGGSKPPSTSNLPRQSSSSCSVRRPSGDMTASPTYSANSESGENAFVHDIYRSSSLRGESVGHPPVLSLTSPRAGSTYGSLTSLVHIGGTAECRSHLKSSMDLLAELKSSSATPNGFSSDSRLLQVIEASLKSQEYLANQLESITRSGNRGSFRKTTSFDDGEVSSPAARTPEDRLAELERQVASGKLQCVEQMSSRIDTVLRELADVKERLAGSVAAAQPKGCEENGHEPIAKPVGSSSSDGTVEGLREEVKGMVSALREETHGEVRAAVAQVGQDVDMKLFQLAEVSAAVEKRQSAELAAVQKKAAELEKVMVTAADEIWARCDSLEDAMNQNLQSLADTYLHAKAASPVPPLDKDGATSVPFLHSTCTKKHEALMASIAQVQECMRTDGEALSKSLQELLAKEVHEVEAGLRTEQSAVRREVEALRGSVAEGLKRLEAAQATDQVSSRVAALEGFVQEISDVKAKVEVCQSHISELELQLPEPPRATLAPQPEPSIQPSHVPTQPAPQPAPDASLTVEGTAPSDLVHAHELVSLHKAVEELSTRVQHLEAAHAERPDVHERDGAAVPLPQGPATEGIDTAVAAVSSVAAKVEALSREVEELKSSVERLAAASTVGGAAGQRLAAQHDQLAQKLLRLEDLHTLSDKKASGTERRTVALVEATGGRLDAAEEQARQMAAEMLELRQRLDTSRLAASTTASAAGAADTSSRQVVDSLETRVTLLESSVMDLVVALDTLKDKLAPWMAARDPTDAALVPSSEAGGPGEDAWASRRDMEERIGRLEEAWAEIRAEVGEVKLDVQEVVSHVEATDETQAAKDTGLVFITGAKLADGTEHGVPSPKPSDAPSTSALSSLSDHSDAESPLGAETEEQRRARVPRSGSWLTPWRW